LHRPCAAVERAKPEGCPTWPAQAAAPSQRDILALIAHELRNPLQAVRSAAALLTIRSAAGASPERNAIGVIERQVMQITRLVDDLLDVSRIGTGKLCLHVQPTRLDEVLQSAVEANQASIDARALRLWYTGLPGPVWVQGDAVRLTQVFSNLLDNAAKFSHAEGVIDIRVLTVGSTGQVEVLIRDEGMGIAPELIGSVFELYVGRAQPASPHGGGLGIGLSVVRSLVELHGGQVAVRSGGAGRGSEFIVTLPAAKPPADEDPAVDIVLDLEARESAPRA
jgi:signal transduction histidine kinase